MKRFLAIAASIVMVTVAISIRSSIDSGGSGATSPSGPITIACVTELADQCNALLNITVRVEDASTTAKSIAAGTAHIDGWVTFDPWPKIANQLAQRSATSESASLAASPIVIAMVQERADALAPVCGGSVTWRCLGDAIGQRWTDVGGRPEWGTVKAGIPPSASGLGLLILGNAAMAYFGRPDIATNDFDDSFVVWRSKVTATPASFADFILKFPAAFSGVGTTDREIAIGKGTRVVATIVPNPATAAVVVLTSVDSRRALGLSKDLTTALTRSGWGPPAQPEPTALFDPGVLLALSGLTR
jgi:hypothetical protein